MSTDFKLMCKCISEKRNVVSLIEPEMSFCFVLFFPIEYKEILKYYKLFWEEKGNL